MKSRFPSTSRYASAQDDIAGEGEKQVLRLRAPLRMTSWWRVKSRSFDFALRAPLRMTSWWWEARRSSFEGGSRFESGNQSSDRRLPVRKMADSTSLSRPSTYLRIFKSNVFVRPWTEAFVADLPAGTSVEIYRSGADSGLCPCQSHSSQRRGLSRAPSLPAVSP
jgi:hypothetical protein